MHQLLRWANRREVARELTRRGFDVSGETLNRWVREEREVPSIVERMVLDMYGMTQEEAAEPVWVRRLETKLDLVVSNQGIVADAALKRLVSVLAPAGRVEDVESLAAELRRVPPPSGEAPPDSPSKEGRGTGARGGRESA